MLFSVMRTFILDFFDFHSRINALREVSTSQRASVMTRFISMLERGDYRARREVSHYASELCVTPKHLSQISREVTGFSAGWWINRFTSLDISRQLRDKSQSITDIAESFNFTSLSYFTRYVCRHLGQSPSEYRG
jgi:AraC-like DNA-binding protein